MDRGAQAPLFCAQTVAVLKTGRTSKGCLQSMLYFTLGDFVRHPQTPDWGVGQVQSIVGMNVTVNFPHAGKQMINCAIIELEKVDRADDTPSG